ncbi:MAG: sulfatase-like hydrolase/transferase [Candidatus Latescibacteria bacterium]|nr:sulfatase-like hydrolase/transferase [Candidatus Latescibacterota bacterium]
MTRPNIVFILADDLGWRDLGGEGSPLYESPHIDRIAREGMRFSQGYAACQVCSPSRASILTGKYTPRHGITDWIGARTGTAWRQNGRHNKLLPPDYEHGLRSDEITLAAALKRAGYRTFFAGKWHLGDEGAYPEDFGFEINKGGWRVGSPAGGYFAPYKNPKLDDGPDGESLPIRLGRETAQFIEANQDRPFLAYLSFYSVHGPIQTSLERWGKYRDKALQQGVPEGQRFIMDRNLPVRQVQDCPIYGGMIEAMDEGVGLVLAALDRLGLADNTIVCFTSDNGGVASGDAFATANLPLRGGKGRQWEGGIREPFYIKAPGVQAGSVCDVPVSGIDYYPTLLDLAGVPVPEGQQVDGMSLAPLLAGHRDERVAGRDLFWHYPHYGNQGGDPSAIIRRGDWKLIHYFEDGHDELYNLAADPGEQADRAGYQPGEAAMLRQRLDEWLVEVKARLPVPDPDYEVAAEQQRLQQLGGEFMAQLERQHADYLRSDWQPNDDWWGSQVTVD